ncbi:MAG: SpoIID/LytB domain-containing protein [Clostridia bacterium]
MDKKSIRWLALLVMVAMALMLGGCMMGGTGENVQDDTQGTQAGAGAPAPKIPERLELSQGVPQLLVYNAQTEQYQQMDMEDYLAGVLAGEMRNDWPMEALKAQAILARTYALKFMEDKQSRYGGADISTDVREAQAYDAGKVNERVQKAVEATRGEVLSAGGELPYAWFHAHAGNVTELATAALEFDGEEPPYTQSVRSPDSDKAPTTVKQWKARYSAEEVGAACADTGVKTGTVKTLEIGEKGASGRAVTFVVNGKTVSAPALRLALDGTKFKSTLLDGALVEGDKVTFSGKGYGHGVGMSQWGAYGMAESGAKAEDIVKHYFKNVEIAKLWA